MTLEEEPRGAEDITTFHRKKQTMMFLLTLLSEDKSLTAAVRDSSCGWISDGLPPPATQCQTSPNTHAALLGSVASVCQLH